MVIILLKFFLLCKKLKDGNLLETKELEVIRGYLAYKFTYIQLRGLIILALGLTLNIIVMILYDLIYVDFIIGIFTIIALFYNLPVTVKYNRQLYRQSLIGFLEKNLQEYQNYHLVYTSYIVHSGYQVQTPKVYFFYDDYYFKIVEDILEFEAYTNGKKRYIFKYPVKTSLDIRPITFKLRDILGYSCLTQTPFRVESYETLIDKEIMNKAEFKLIFSDLKTIYLGNELYDYFKKIVPDLEQKKN